MKGLWPVVLLGLAVVGFGWMVAAQFGSGEVYRFGSTLRTDREGASVLFEALAETGGKTGRKVERNYGKLAGLGGTLVMLNILPAELEKPETAAEWMALARGGARVVVALNGYLEKPVKPAGWDLTIFGTALNEDVDEDEFPIWAMGLKGGDGWKAVREEDGEVVAAERRSGKGWIAVVASTQPFLNLAMRDSRDLELMGWAVGEGGSIRFDESHLGSREGGSVAGLLRRLRLEGFLAVMLGASLLFFWRASVPFPAVGERDAGEDFRIGGVASKDGLRNLLERRIPVGGLLAACVAEWRRDQGRRAGEGTVAAVEAVSGLGAVAGWERIRETVRVGRRRI